MKVHGNIDLNLNKLNKFAIDTVAEFPNDPIVGRLIFRSDLQQLFICTRVNPSVIWFPLLARTVTYVHEQITVSNEWLITHELDTEDVFVQVYGTDEKVIIPEEIIVLNNNQIKILFAQNVAGKALLAGLNNSFKFQKSSLEISFPLSSIWNVNHGLGYYPHVTVLNNSGQVVIPDKVIHIDKNNLRIEFTDTEIDGKVIVS